VELFTGRQSLREHTTCIGAKDTEAVESFLKINTVPTSARLLIISPGSDRMTRRWQAERFAKAADIIATKHELTTIIIGSASEHQAAEEVRKTMKTTAINAAGSFTISGTLALIGRSQLVICTNSALMHMAGILSVPLVSIAGSGDIPRDTPDGDARLMRLLKLPIPCSPCYHYSCPRGKTNECMQNITVEHVIAASEEVLS
jgi:heptosyltransferase-2